MVKHLKFRLKKLLKLQFLVDADFQNKKGSIY